MAPFPRAPCSSGSTQLAWDPASNICGWWLLSSQLGRVESTSSWGGGLHPRTSVLPPSTSCSKGLGGSRSGADVGLGLWGVTKALLCWTPPLLGASGGAQTQRGSQTEVAPSVSPAFCRRNQRLSSTRRAGRQCRICPRRCRPPRLEAGQFPPTCSGAEAQGPPPRWCCRRTRLLPAKKRAELVIRIFYQ